MALSYSRITVEAGGSTSLAVPFEYLSRDHVSVFRDDVRLLLPDDYSWVSDGSIALVAPTVTGEEYLIRRSTPRGSLVMFGGGSLDVEDLDTAHLQPLYLAQEALDWGGDGGVNASDIIGQFGDAAISDLDAQKLTGTIDLARLPVSQAGAHLHRPLHHAHALHR